MPPKQAAPARSNSKASSKSAKASVTPSRATGSAKSQKQASAVVPLEKDADFIPALAALPLRLSSSTNPRRAEYVRRFKELSELILSSDATYQISTRNKQQQQLQQQAHGTTTTSALPTVDDDYFPTLMAGFLARSMGLNLTEEQVVLLVELVEDDAASRGTVSRRRLEGVIIDALMTGVLGGPTLVSSGVLTAAEVPPGWLPSCCLREDEDEIFRAFAVVDHTHKGYLTAVELRTLMTTVGDAMTEEEVDEMLTAMGDEDAQRIYYRDFASVLARD